MLGKLLILLLVVVLSFGSMLISGCKNCDETNAAVIATDEAVNYAVKNEADKKRTEQEIQKLRDESNTVIVNITASNGSVKPIVLKRQGNVYVGPKGEQYLSVPTPEQLMPVYGF